jgi:hypothetical protein
MNNAFCLTARRSDRPTFMASKIDEVQLRRLQEAEQGHKSLGGGRLPQAAATHIQQAR